MKIRSKSINVFFRDSENRINSFLENVNLEIPSDKICLLYGPSGSGKTTLFNILCGLAPMCDKQGEVFWGDYKVGALTEANRQRAKYISLIFSTFYFLESLNVEQNILLPALLLGKDQQESSKKLDALCELFSFDGSLETLHLGKLRKRKVTSLSNGQKEMVGIARGLVLDSPYIFADEMLRSFNPEGESAIWERMVSSPELGIGTSRGMFMITHKEHLKNDPHIGVAYRIKDKGLVLC